MNPDSVNYYGTTNDLNARLRGAGQADADRGRFGNGNDDGSDSLAEFRRRVAQMVDISLSRSADVYTFEIDETD